MKAVVLSDNRKTMPDFETEHGLSIYLETNGLKILLDTGGSDLFLQNAVKLNIDLRTVDNVFISHGYIDHIGGLSHFLRVNSKAKILLSQNAIIHKFYSKRNGNREIGLSFDFKRDANRLVYVDNEFRLDNGIYVFANTTSVFNQPLANQMLFCRSEDGEVLSDIFSHELIFTIDDGELIVYIGCAHHGLLNMLETVKEKSSRPIQWVIGGYHILDSKDGQCYESEFEIKNLAEYIINKYPDVTFYTGHCTVDEVFRSMKKILNGSLNQFYVGSSIQN